MYHLARSLYMQLTSKPEYSILLLGLDNAGKTTLLNQIKNLYNTSTTATDPGLGVAGELPASDKAGNTVPTVGQNVTTIEMGDMYIKIWDVGGQLSLRRLWMGYYRVAHAVVFVVDSTDLGSGFIGDEEGDEDRAGGGGGSGGKKGSEGWQTVGRKKSYREGSVAVGGADGGVGANGEGELSPPTPMTPWTPMTPLLQQGFPGFAVQGQHSGRLEECRAVLESVLGHEDAQGIPVLVLANKQDREDCLEVVRIKEGFVRKVFEGEKGGMVRDSRVLPVSALKGTGVKDAVEWVRKRVVGNKEGRPPVMR